MLRCPAFTQGDTQQAALCASTTRSGMNPLLRYGAILTNSPIRARKIGDISEKG